MLFLVDAVHVSRVSGLKPFDKQIPMWRCTAVLRLRRSEADVRLLGGRVEIFNALVAAAPAFFGRARGFLRAGRGLPRLRLVSDSDVSKGSVSETAG